MGTRSGLNKAARQTMTGLKNLSNNIAVVDQDNTWIQAPVCNFSNAIEVDAATLTLAYATHAARPVIQRQACVFTLPGIGVVGQTLWVINGAANGTLMTIVIDNADKFLWDVAGAAGTNSKDIYNTAATALKGDYIKLSFGSSDGWIINEMGGIWVDEA